MIWTCYSRISLGELCACWAISPIMLKHLLFDHIHTGSFELHLGKVAWRLTSIYEYSSVVHYVNLNQTYCIIDCSVLVFDLNININLQ